MRETVSISQLNLLCGWCGMVTACDQSPVALALIAACNASANRFWPRPIDKESEAKSANLPKRTRPTVTSSQLIQQHQLPVDYYLESNYKQHYQT